jgi:RHH-type proline utilization regulon transcriptional repressor/proline dehydrogenase/delta 1-pyrroline-5-carboxylate dehydrogenase
MGDLQPFADGFTLEYAPAPESTAVVDIRDEYGLFVDGEFVEPRSGRTFDSVNPATEERLCAVAEAGEEDVDVAVAAARTAWERRWRDLPGRERAKYLYRIARQLQERAREFAVLESIDGGKPIKESRDFDIPMAAAHFFYYAGWADKLGYAFPGRRARPLGVAGQVIPWNFPLLMAAWKIAPALATGNTVVLKPAEQAPGCGLRVVEALRAGGVPAGAIALLPGEGEAGAALASHPDVATIAFTGSGKVGLELLRTAADVPAGARQLKRVVAEMGGKNCVIVDADADLDEAVPAIVASAFGYAGQKCSAAARVLAHEAIHDVLVQRLAGAVAALEVGPAEDFASDVPPVIEQSAQQRVRDYAARAAEQGTVVAGERELPGEGWYCAPIVATGLPPDSDVLRDEIFGPLVTVEPVRDVDEACDRVDALAVALTGALFARNPRTVQRVAARSPVGNLYVNRSTTGAMVGRQPFGGNRLSGTGTKAGGSDYLLHFVEPRVVTENTLRHGLVV